MEIYSEIQVIYKWRAKNDGGDSSRMLGRALGLSVGQLGRAKINTPRT